MTQNPPPEWSNNPPEWSNDPSNLPPNNPPGWEPPGTSPQPGTPSNYPQGGQYPQGGYPQGMPPPYPAGMQPAQPNPVAQGQSDRTTLFGWLGIVIGFLCCAIVGIVLGILSIRDAKRFNNSPVLGYVAIVASVLNIIGGVIWAFWR